MAERPRRRKKSGFLERYRLDERYLRRPERAAGRVGLLEGTGPGGEPVLIKVWPRAARQNDADLEAIWRNEIRQLQRMSGHPAAHEVIARLADAAVEQDGFYLVIEPGSRRPLAAILEHARPGLWLTAPRLPANRLRIWRNCRRIAQALEALHAEGMLHRDLDAWSVLTSAGEETDFQLTGFEWSMRLVTTAGSHRSGPRKAIENPLSFRDDWAAFGKLIASLIEADAQRLGDLALPAFDVAPHLPAAEVRLVRNLTGLEYLDRLDGDVVLNQIDQILTALAAEAAGKEAKLHLVLDLRPESKIGRTVAAHLATDIASVAPELEQIIEGDLAEGPVVVAVADGDAIKLILRGQDYWYWLSPYRAPRATHASWDYAQCTAIAKQGPASVNVIGTLRLAPAGLELMTWAEAPARFARSRGRLRTWETIRSGLVAKREVVDPSLEFHRALTLTLIIELLFAVAETFPVVIVPIPSDSGGEEESILHLVSRPDDARDRLADALGIAPPAERLRIALTGDGVRREGWIVTTEENLGQRSAKDDEWKFEGELIRAGKRPTYKFRGSNPPSATEPLFLVPEDSVGRDAQLRRRLKALAALREHLELQLSLTHPAAAMTASHDLPPADKDLGDLDESKREALKEIVASLPLFLVQGPPGVGKTRLVRELVKRRFEEDSTLRVLLSAQSNAAVDHLLDEVVPATRKVGSEPLIVRCGGAREGEVEGLFRLSKVSRDLLANIASSKLVADARPALRDGFLKLERGARAHVATVQAGTRAPYPVGLRTFEGVVMRAANLVFATTNSADLERLIEERSQFDWSIIEEAGKATGTELIAPQLLSHRRLMIGDHKQLPPFNAEQMIALLSQPEKVVDALTIGAEFIGRSLRDEATEAILDEVEEDPELAPALCARAIEALTLFQTLIEKEFKRRPGKSGKTFAKRLSEQHRMHPVIARLIGRTFYADHSDGALETHEDSKVRFATKPCPVRSLDNKRLPEVPIVLVDIESKQAAQGRVRGEETPRWHNRDEREAIRLVLGQLRPDTKPGPSLAILSPYAQQVKRLAEMVATDPDIDPAALGFAPPGANGTFCFTVDSFQGSEADVVIVSLVRNNASTTIRNALGFLAQYRRMNVLLSRAKWRLIVVGSFEFLEEILRGSRIDGTSAEIEFLGKLFDELASATPDEVRRICVADLAGCVA